MSRSYRDERCSGEVDNLSCLVNDRLRKRPIFCLYYIPNGGEVRFIIFGPELWSKNDMLELSSVRYLFIVQ